MKKTWIALPLALPLALALAACTSTAGSADGAASATSGAADNGVVAAPSSSADGEATPSAAASPQDSTSPAAGAQSGPASVQASVEPDVGGGAAGSYTYVVTLTNNGGQPATLTAPYLVTLHDNVDANLSNTQPLDFTKGAPSATLAPGEEVHALLKVTDAGAVPRCRPQQATFLNIDSPSGTLKAPIDKLEIQGCDGGLAALLSAR